MDNFSVHYEKFMESCKRLEDARLCEEPSEKIAKYLDTIAMQNKIKIEMMNSMNVYLSKIAGK